MSDLIRREDAIDKIREVYEYEFPTASGSFDEFVTVIIPNLLRNLPSAEPERKCAKDARCTERAAKILNRSEGFYSAHGVCICGHCEHCGNAVCDDFRFCPYCGTTLDWS